MKESIVIRKSGGFYSVFDDDAIVVNYLTGYKVVNGKLGFPLNSLDKVINLLEDNKINYIVREGMKEVVSKNYKKNNKYGKVLDKGKKKYDIDYRVSSIIDKINNLDYDRLCKLLDSVEEYINE